MIGQRMHTTSVATIAIALLLGAGPGLAGLADNGQGAGTEGPLTVGGGWTYFFWLGSTVYGAPFTYSDGLTFVRVTDAYCYGDQFEVLDNGDALGETSEPGSSACGGPSDPAKAYADPKMSSGCFLTPAADDHRISLRLLRNPFGSGGAFIRVDTPVDDPLGFAECVLRPLGVRFPADLPGPL